MKEYAIIEKNKVFIIDNVDEKLMNEIKSQSLPVFRSYNLFEALVDEIDYEALFKRRFRNGYVFGFVTGELGIYDNNIWFENRIQKARGKVANKLKNEEVELLCDLVMYFTELLKKKVLEIKELIKEFLQKDESEREEEFEKFEIYNKLISNNFYSFKIFSHKAVFKLNHEWIKDFKNAKFKSIEQIKNDAKTPLKIRRKLGLYERYREMIKFLAYNIDFILKIVIVNEGNERVEYHLDNAYLEKLDLPYPEYMKMRGRVEIDGWNYVEDETKLIVEPLKAKNLFVTIYDFLNRDFFEDFENEEMEIVERIYNRKKE